MRIAAALSLLLALCPPAYAADKVLAVHDGDTFTVSGTWAVVSGRRILHRLPGHVTLRVFGIDTPEIGGKARCPAENTAAEKARDNLKALFAANGGMVDLGALGRDKYGRLLGQPSTKAGSIAAAQLSGGFAVAYGGTGLRHDWCGAAGMPENLLPESISP